MIRVQSIHIKEFRGIRDLTLICNGRNFAICGPNGTGKSGVVDALEFALTGSVSRLSGEGRGGVSLAKHGPHVDRRDDPNKSTVTVVLAIPNLKKTVTLERCVKTAGAVRITPDEPDVRAILTQVSAHPEFVLSRRELIRYVLATPGHRQEEVGALLHLEQVERVRTGLQKIANASERMLPVHESAVKNASANLLRALEISELTKDRVLSAANIRRAILGLAPLIDLTPSISLKDGMATPTPPSFQKIPKAHAQADLVALRRVIEELTGPEVKAEVNVLLPDILAIAKDRAASEAVTREGFYTTGLDLTADPYCPFCDLPWDLTALKEHIKEKLEHLKEVSEKRKSIQEKLRPIVDRLRQVQAAFEKAVQYGSKLAPAIPSLAISEHVRGCAIAVAQIEALTPFADTIKTLSTLTSCPPAVLGELGIIEKAVKLLPEPTEIDAARDWLSVAQERLSVWREAGRERKIAKDRAERARRVSNIYAGVSDAVLTDLYQTVQKQFAEYYAFVNRDDESGFSAKLAPSAGKLGFDVDFYGRGLFPPGAYHSEGHQDSMGLCLYLALMRHLQGSTFSFAVLDDVLMSVDAPHRREVCTLLKKHFPDTQFIITTHDPIWLRHMKTEGIIREQGSVQFRDWSIDHGPSEWNGRTVWSEIDEYLGNGDVRAAASLLRHFLEYISRELCHRLRAPVEFRGDAQYELGDLLPAAIGRLKKVYGKAKDAATSWNQQELLATLSTREAEFGSAVSATNADQWQVNVAVHYNTWENLGRKDFEPVVRSFRELLSGFTCRDCGEYLHVSPHRQEPETLRCACGKTSFNLKKKQ